MFRTPLLLLPLALLGCQSAPEPRQPEIYFATRILDDGSKLFSYTLVRQQQGQRRSKGAGRGKGNRTRGDRTGAPAAGDARFLQLLESRLEQSGFCLTGYELSYSEVNERQVRYRGQCREKA
ncbi:hypothetical protein [Gallaecimonas sp. GXIMD4217]|uniref:hypothetical protein n=1 Tax=Gallaecimonas sp. GXIMD4217 TaxID=3131927 RepID=UPI00311ABF3C